MIGTYNTGTTTDTLWTRWSSETSATDTTSSADLFSHQWYNWHGATTGGTVRYVANHTHYRQAPPRPSPESQRIAAVAMEKKEAAKQAAEQLLFAHLTEEQRAMYRKLKRFRVVSADGRSYEIDAAKRMHNVFELDEAGRRVKEFCIYQANNTPLADNHLGQMLLLEADETLFRKIANARILVAS